MLPERRSEALPEAIPRHSEIIQERIAACSLSAAIAKTTGSPPAAIPETIEIACYAQGRSATPGEG